MKIRLPDLIKGDEVKRLLIVKDNKRDNKALVFVNNNASNYFVLDLLSMTVGKRRKCV